MRLFMCRCDIGRQRWIFGLFKENISTENGPFKVTCSAIGGKLKHMIRIQLEAWSLKLTINQHLPLRSRVPLLLT